VTVNPASGDGFHIAATPAPNFTLTDTSAAKNGSVLIDGAHNGIWLYGGSLTLDNLAVTIQNCEGYGVYNCNGSAAFTMTGGSFNIKDCGATNSDEGGFEWDNGTVTFKSGVVNITGCGYGHVDEGTAIGFGAIYAGGDLIFGDGGTIPLHVTLENNPNALAVKNEIVMVGKAAKLNIASNATVDITIAGEYENCRGINIGGTGTTVTVDGKLNISKDAYCVATTVYGIKGVAGTQLKVNAGGIVNISGYSPAANVLPNVYVTMNGGSMDLGGSFGENVPTNTLRLDADAALNETLTIAADTTVDTNGHDFTVKPALGEDGIYVNTGAKLTLDGSAAVGSLTVDGSSTTSGNPRGIDCAGSLTVESGTVNVKNTAGYGIGGDAVGTAFNMTGGALNITDCGKTSEGGFIWSKDYPSSTCQFLGGTVNMTDCGNTLFGCMYVGCPLTFGSNTETDPLTVNLENNPASTGVKNAIVLVGGKNLTINKNATVNITIAGTAAECRGINIGTSASTLAVNGGTLNISKVDSCTAKAVHGVRGSSCTPKMNVTTNSVVNISGCSEKSALTGMIVTITGGSMNLGGESVNNAAAAGATSITNGEDAVTLQKQSANDYSVAINKANAKSSTVYPYTYTSHVTGGGVYAWIPVSRVNFYDSNKTTLLGICTAVGDTTWGSAKASAPDMSSHANFNKWVDIKGQDLADATNVSGTLNVYATYTQPSGGGGNPTPAPEPTDVPDPDVPKAELPADLNSTDHIAYIIGKPDGNVDPNGQITRAEVATAFYRLLTAERRDAIFTSTSTFSDVSKTQWFNKAVASMANGKYIKGYTDGTFGGNRSITRAEFVAIAARFMDAKSGTVTFSDVSSTNWAYQYISTAVAYGWINGYPDGTFKPDQAISRAEAMKIINTMLARGVDAAGLISGIKAWPDNTNVNAWYYYEIIEATNNHLYEGSRPSEKWSSLQTNYVYDIVKYEHP
jgi:hypothetical protein